MLVFKGTDVVKVYLYSVSTQHTKLESVCGVDLVTQLVTLHVLTLYSTK